ncbi:hypothetical protein MKW98_029467 [Papaver atlanticum]|uniref:beta-N-acetylhexosaminidase n=1 Tax=Papaver atlanticum TaxID=357466 RepID=A0AAD4SIL6_9MAGN|nr:hypothetical protein MKW98_029467 [Papaver atlanticum]
MGEKRRNFIGGLFLVVVLLSGCVSGDVDVNIWPMPKSVKYGGETLQLSKDFGLETSGTNFSDHFGDIERWFFEILQYGIDESYDLYIPSNGDSVYAHLQAQTVYGALHGLQTFSQLCQFNFETKTIEVQQAPWSIADEPRFSYRGLLIDTSRHYLPLPTIKKVIYPMAYTKLVLLLIFVSGFGNITMGVGYPQLWPSPSCQQPLDVSNEFTFEVIDGILSDFSKVFNFKFVHLGGDEVNGSCWETTPHIKYWLRKRQMNASEAYEYFVLRAQKIALPHGYEIVNWEETLRNFGSKLSPKTVVHNWLDRVGGGLVQKAVAEGLRCIVSNQENWYLDHLDATWKQFYMNEPFTNITNPEHQKLVLGGEVCMWGETIDTSDIEQTIWPRAAAAAERMWTPLDQLARHPRKVRGRLSRFRCLLNQRGVAAAPLSWLGRDAPTGPGSCYNQWLYNYNTVQKK